MALFGRVCFPRAFKKDTPPFHKKIFETISDRSKKRVMIASPRGSSKSTLASFLLPVFEIAFKPSSEDLFIVIISESQNQSINFLSRIKYHLDSSETFKKLFGDFGHNTATKWSNTDIILKNGARIMAVGTGQRVRGFIQDDTRPNLIIVDDFESEKNAATAELRARNRKWMTEAVIPSLADEGRLVMIGTVISEDCFLYWAKKSSAWEVLWFSIVDDQGNSIWPSKFPKERIEQIKAEFESVGNLNGFYQEYMNKAQSPSNAPFKPKFIYEHDYDFEYIGEKACLVKGSGEEKEIKPVNVYGGVDPASSLSEVADFFVIAIVGIDSEDNKYVIDIFRDHLDPAYQPDKIIEYYKKYRPLHMKIETVAYQEALRASVRRAMFDEDLYIPGLEKGVQPRRRKSERLLSLVPIFAKKKFFFRPEDVNAQKEFLSYPKGKHDDCMDAIWTALQRTYKCNDDDIGDIGEYYGDYYDKFGNKSVDWMVL